MSPCRFCRSAASLPKQFLSVIFVSVSVHMILGQFSIALYSDLSLLGHIRSAQRERAALPTSVRWKNIKNQIAYFRLSDLDQFRASLFLIRITIHIAAASKVSGLFQTISMP